MSAATAPSPSDISVVMFGFGETIGEPGWPIEPRPTDSSAKNGPAGGYTSSPKEMSSIVAPAGSPSDVPGITTAGGASGPIAGDPGAGLRVSPGMNGDGPPALTPKLGSALVERGSVIAATPRTATTAAIFSARDA